MTLRPRLIFVCYALLAFASGALGAGEYQQTKDNKTKIWNGNPRAGDTSTWSGDRDKENYATGFGDLTMYEPNGKAYALYYGNMVHGKFEGPVNLHTNSRTSHAYFVDGNRVTPWGWGAAKSTMTASEAALVEKRRAEAEKIAAARKKEEKPEPTPVKKPEIAEKTKETTPPPSDRTAKGTGTYNAEATPEPSAVITETAKPTPAKARAVARTDASPSGTPVRAFLEPTPLPKIAQSSPPTIQETPVPAESPAAQEKVDNTSRAPKAASESTETTESRRDVSVNALVGPPSSLRSTEENSSARTSNDSAASASDHLTESAAVSLADAEARNQGYNLENYERPKADYSEVKQKWILYYEAKKSADHSSGETPLSVSVEDKTKRVEIRK